jgi:hypothetical protein
MLAQYWAAMRSALRRGQNIEATHRVSLEERSDEKCHPLALRGIQQLRVSQVVKIVQTVVKNK